MPSFELDSFDERVAEAFNCFFPPDSLYNLAHLTEQDLHIWLGKANVYHRNAWIALGEMHSAWKHGDGPTVVVGKLEDLLGWLDTTGDQPFFQNSDPLHKTMPEAFDFFVKFMMAYKRFYQCE